MSGTKMTMNKRDLRNIQSYLSRRKIADKATWLSSSSIKTIGELQAFCVANLLHMDENEWLDFFTENSDVNPKTITAPLTSKVEAKSVEKSEDEKSWHTPAAKRPIKKSTSKRASRSSSKKSSTKDSHQK